MSAAVFESRWKRLAEWRSKGFIELEDHLGSPADLGPLVRCGLLVKRGSPWLPFQRYHGFVPTMKGERILVHDRAHELILVPSGKVPDLIEALAADPLPGAPFHPGFCVVEHLNGLAVREPRRPLHVSAPVGMLMGASADRAHVKEKHLEEGYEDFEQFRIDHVLRDRALLASGLCREHDPSRDFHGIAFVPQGEGFRYFTLLKEHDLLLVNPGMGLPLLDLLDPTRAAYWTPRAA
jgi:hypothetical protein